MPTSAASWLSKNMAGSSYKKPSGTLAAWAASKSITRPSSKSTSRPSSSSSSRSVALPRKAVDPKKAELEKKRRVDMKSLRMRTLAEERARLNPRERFKKRNSLNSNSQFRRLTAMPGGEEPVALDDPATEIDRYATYICDSKVKAGDLISPSPSLTPSLTCVCRKVEELIRARRAEREQRAGQEAAALGILTHKRMVPSGWMFLTLFSMPSGERTTKLVQLPTGSIPILEQKRRREQEAQRRRELLSPSLDSLHEIILGWDYFDLDASVITPPPIVATWVQSS
jgi:hypothetical protein